VDEHLLYVVRLADQLESRRRAAYVRGQEPQARRDGLHGGGGEQRRGQIDMVGLHVDDEVATAESLPARGEVFAVLALDGQHGRVAPLVEAMNLVQDHERRRG